MEKKERKTRIERDKEIYEAYKRVKSAHIRPMKRRELVEEVINAAQTRFPVSYDYAYKILTSHKPRQFKKQERQEMWEELRQCVADEMRRNRHLYKSQALVRVLLLKKTNRLPLTRAYVYRYLFQLIDENRKRNNRLIA